MIQQLELPSSSNPGRYGADGYVRLINCYPESRGKEGKIVLPLYASDGLSLFATLTGGGQCRGAIEVNGALWVVSGRLLFKVTSSGIVTTIGAVPGTGPCYMAQNQKSPTPQIVIVSEGIRFIVNDGVLETIDDSDLVAPNSVVFLNQRFVFTALSGRFQWSELSEGNDYEQLEFATAEYGHDGLVRAFVRRGELLLIGTKTIEPWYSPDAEGANAFARTGTVIERGCANGATVAMVEETIVLVADDLTVRALEGYQARKISNNAVERAIRDTSDPTQMVAWSYSKDGHSFYVLQGTDFTWLYDSATGEWHERNSYGLSRWRAQFYAKLGEHHIVGDYEEGKLYEIDEDTFTENGEHLVMSMTIPINAYPNAVELNTLLVDGIPGAGLNSSDEHDANPEMMARVSRNGGKTFGSQRERPVGRIGTYSTQTKFNGFGTSKEDGFVVEVSMSAAVIRAITGAAADVNVVPR